MVLRLAKQLEVPLRERNALLMAAGYAPVFRARSFEDPMLQAARKAVDLVLAGHEPYPALAVDRHWTLVASNRAVAFLLTGAEPSLLTAPINVLRLTLHPGGLVQRIVNLLEWRSHLLARLQRQIEASGDAILVDLLNQLRAYPVPSENKLKSKPRSTMLEWLFLSSLPPKAEFSLSSARPPFSARRSTLLCLN
jgi:hypothetical protein